MVLWDPKRAMESKRRRRFEGLVAEVLAGLPDSVVRLLDNVTFRVEDEAPDDPTRLGQYQGLPRTLRHGYSMALPDSIVLYRKPLERAATSMEALRQEILRTIIHEIAHHLGMEEKDIERLLGPDYL